MSTARIVEPARFDWFDPSIYTFSLGLEAAGATWLSGHTASFHNPDTGRIEVRGDTAAQTTTAWEKIAAIADSSQNHLAAATEIVEYLTVDGFAARADVAGARPADAAASGPADSVLMVESLARPEAHIEIEVVTGRPDGLVRLPQILPVHDGEVVHRGDFVAQCRWVLERAGELLAEHGLDLSHVVRTVQQTTPATRDRYRATADARRELLGPDFPASTGLLVGQVPHDDPDVGVALDVWASPHPKTVVNPGWRAFDQLTFSPGVLAGGVLYLSGTTAWDAETNTNVAPGDVAAQAAFVFEQLDAVCRAAGGSIADLVKTIEYITPPGLAGYRDVGGVRARLLERPYPASTGVVVNGLLSREWQIEIDGVAVIG